MSKEKIFETAEKYIKERKYDRAIKELQSLLAYTPHDLRLKLKVAEVFAKKRDLSLAIKTYQEVAEEYIKSNFYLKAIAVYKNILKINPALVDINEKLGDLFHNVGMENESINQYQIIAGYYESHGKNKEALKIREKMVAADPSSTTNRMRLAELYQNEGEAENSLKHYETAASTILGNKSKTGLIEVYEKILHLKPNNPKIALSLSRLYFQKKEFEKIIRLFEKAPEKVKGDDEIFYLAAEACLRVDQVQEAKKRFKALYQKKLDEKDWRVSDYLYGRIRQEFEMDDDYFSKVEEIRVAAGRPPTSLPEDRRAAAQTKRPDLERTDEFDISKITDSGREKKTKE
ncbi:MAG: hypothetical protein A3I75_01585 [Deltaproteobacteria bacterium RIFCSPLOWO2_02_FULL_50_16]|nr:MAG: hypothetical protein A3B79_03595 [Deltaproteobacteria bacterium RIFCSPHIGHO2_02_FULL_50_15]OGQ56109.1 MAG: hypothetical protein A3I75_01585 [Deltaproteobacteria bacterium RIFCSPLOWO2_02_FULL_50_16]OGQ68430.1 MAG: hypothetical protein A3F89_00480 [Deltaproteobacteria bacterium RIFCSPLOWO2_12_FULL_50_11]